MNEELFDMKTINEPSAAAPVPAPRKRESLAKKLKSTLPSEIHSDITKREELKEAASSYSESLLFKNADSDRSASSNSQVPLRLRDKVKTFQCISRVKEHVLKRRFESNAEQAEVRRLSTLDKYREDEIKREQNFEYFRKKYEDWKKSHSDLKEKIQRNCASDEEQLQFFTNISLAESDDFFLASVAPCAKRESDYTDLKEVKIMAKIEPILRPFKMQLETENQLYYFPESNVRQRRVRASTVELEEGVYCGPELGLSTRNVDTMKARLLVEKRRLNLWIHKEEIARLPMSLINFPVKLDFLQSNHASMITSYTPAVTNVQSRMNYGVYQLDVELSKLMFTHHSLFSKEDVLCRRLLEQYHGYERRLRESTSYYYAQRLEDVKSKVRELKAKVNHLNLHNDSEQINDLSRLIGKLQKESRELRKLRNKEETFDLQLLQSMVANWNIIKRLRIWQGYTTTSFKLTLEKYEVDDVKDKEKWEEDLMDELEEREDEHIALQSKNLQNEDSDQSPSESMPFDRNFAWMEICANALKTRRNPGEPLLVPVLGSSSTITPIDQCPKAEKERRQEITRHKIMLKLYYNGKEVCSTQSRPLNLDFCVLINQKFNLMVSEWPQSLSFKIFESSGHGWDEIATVCVPIPSYSQISTPDMALLDEIEFASELKAKYTHSAVGAGNTVNFYLNGVPSCIPRISGVLRCLARWGKDHSGKPLFPPFKERTRTCVILNQNFQFETDSANAVDPNDPKIVAAQNMKSSALCRKDSGALTGFIVVPAECQLVTAGEFLRNLRYRCLQLRSEKVPHLMNIQPFPALDREIPKDILSVDEDILEKGDELFEMKELEQYLRSAKQAAAMRWKLLQSLCSMESTPVYKDLVNEPDLKSLYLLKKFLLTERDRPLRPTQRSLRSLTSQSNNFDHCTNGKVRLIINVIRAFNLLTSNLPLMTTTAATRETDSSILTKKLLQTVVYVRFRDKLLRTSVAEGTNPTWNHVFILEFKPTKTSGGAIDRISWSQYIQFDVFEQSAVEVPKEERNDHHTVCHHIERHWIGSVKIPIITILNQMRIQGNFILSCPPFRLSNYESTKNVATNQLCHPYVQLFFAVEFGLRICKRTCIPVRILFSYSLLSMMLTKQLLLFLASVEDSSVLSYGDHWLEEVRQRHNNRNFLPFVLDSSGRKIIVTRYLRPIPPPPEILALRDDKNATVVFACHLVSRIPKNDEIMVKQEAVHIWNTISDVFQLMRAQEAEHAHLLYSWLSAMEIECYLLLGASTVEGPYAAYVLVKLNTLVICNPTTGSIYDLNDQLCPLFDIACACNSDNIWANIQKPGPLFAMNFDFANASRWRSFWNKRMPARQLPSVQPETLEYTNPNQDVTIKLEARLRKAIADHLMRQRPNELTRFNRFAGQTFRDCLLTMEKNLIQPFNAVDETKSSLQTLLDAYKIFGFAINEPYISQQKLLKTISQTEICNMSDPDMEFTMAVYVQGYSSNILSVWILLASLVRRR
ncbi:Coiled-coil and C2 domain-containing protein 2A [Trichinella britovi]|uniref:Coiled-coil and C2 domain-containing protein 2A n=1 Tax=Trichinella britovi TaxID=45882 RepID=A0A0V1D4V8_TRIBR|nr:Coiled-coil and C2 domain-containing protein 2A [Trichinella britovi]